MREQVPWLAHLRRDRRGLPVPAVNAWGSEADVQAEVRHDPWVGQRALFFDDSTQTVPDFTRQSMQRQRECMVRGLCQVCWRPVPWSRRYVVLSGMSTETIDLSGRAVTVVTEPWLDERCARFAVTTCPALIRRTRDDEMRVGRVQQRDVQLIVSTGWVEGPLEGETRAAPPVMWVKAAIRRVDLWDEVDEG